LRLLPAGVAGSIVMVLSGFIVRNGVFPCTETKPVSYISYLFSPGFFLLQFGYQLFYFIENCFTVYIIFLGGKLQRVGIVALN